MKQRADHDLAFILQYENVAWYDNGTVRILDRRVYPMKTSFVTCTSYQQVAQAIADMVTQSGGPYTAAEMGMALAAHTCRDLPQAQQLAYLETAAEVLATARPTTAQKMRACTAKSLRAAKNAMEHGLNVGESVFLQAVDDLEQRYRMYARVGALLADKVPEGGTIMTQCWGESVVGMLLRACRERHNAIRVICAETRPYFQGARLTASCAADMGFDVTVISDNMPGYVMHEKHVDLFTSAADVITLDGHVVNKVGTFQMALAASYWGIPYYATGIPNRAHPTMESVQMELRDPELVLHALDTKITMQGVKGYYPAFDVTPPKLISGIVTDRGILPAFALEQYDALPEMEEKA